VDDFLAVSVLDAIRSTEGYLLIHRLCGVLRVSISTYRHYEYIKIHKVDDGEERLHALTSYVSDPSSSNDVVFNEHYFTPELRALALHYQVEHWRVSESPTWQYGSTK